MAFLVSGAAAIALAAAVPTLTIVAIASRAFAAYYALQAVIAMRTSTGPPRKTGFEALALVMIAVTVFVVQRAAGADVVSSGTCNTCSARCGTPSSARPSAPGNARSRKPASPSS